jgi:hypothetical protein
MPAVARKKTLPPMSILDPLSEPESIAFPETARKPRKSLAEMAADGNPPGIVCGNCRQTGWIVWYTRPQMGKIVRVRKCRNCGEKTITFERKAGG